MSQALSVEKTSKRGGRIVHEKQLMPPPSLGGGSIATPNPETDLTPPHVTADSEGSGGGSEDPAAEHGGGEAEGGGEYGNAASSSTAQEEKPSITNLMRNPTKVVLCKVSEQDPICC
jgi:hypothetical protein